MLERCSPGCELEMGLEAVILGQVIDGSKTIEGRLKRGKFRQMALGRIVCLREDVWRDGEEISTKPDTARIKVVDVQDFGSFREMLDTVGLENVLPKARSIDEGLSVYYQFYTPEQEIEYGVRGITMELYER